MFLQWTPNFKLVSQLFFTDNLCIKTFSDFNNAIMFFKICLDIYSLQMRLPVQ